MPLTEKERVMAKEINRLEIEVDDLKRKIRIANEFNHRFFKENEDLRFYIRQMEGGGVGEALRGY